MEKHITEGERSLAEHNVTDAVSLSQGNTPSWWWGNRSARAKPVKQWLEEFKIRGEHLSTLHHSELEPYFRHNSVKEGDYVIISAFEDISTFFALTRYRKAMRAEVPLSQINLYCAFQGDLVGLHSSEHKLLCNDIYSQGTYAFYNSDDQILLYPLSDNTEKIARFSTVIIWAECEREIPRVRCPLYFNKERSKILATLLFSGNSTINYAYANRAILLTDQ